MTSAAPLLFDSTQVLVLGAGLAGLRAAMAAREADPSCRVLVATNRAGPAGSSFANRNNALGMQAPATDAEAEALASRAQALAGPGLVVPSLAQVLARESAARMQEFATWGLHLDTGPGGVPKRVTGCFFPEQRSAVIIRDLAGAFHTLAARLEGLGGALAPGLSVLGLIQDASPGGQVRGALFRTQDNSLLAVQARTVILALGGPAPLLARHAAGPGNPGHALALMKRAGVSLANERFLQCIWYEADSLGAVPLTLLDRPDAGLVNENGSVEPLPPRLARLCPERAAHWPAAHGLPDAELDRALLATARQDRQNGGPGRVTLALPEALGMRHVRAELLAQAGNGGALIDEQGATNVPGLYACGECAAGMHGADRIGGAMVAATQVFGRRAGQAAAKAAESCAALADREFTDLARLEAKDTEGIMLSPQERAALQHALGDLVPWPGGATSPSIAEETVKISAGLRREDRLFLESCRALTGA